MPSIATRNQILLVVLAFLLVLIGCEKSSTPTGPIVDDPPVSVVLSSPEDVTWSSLTIRWSGSDIDDFFRYRLFQGVSAVVDTNSTLVTTKNSVTDTVVTVENLTPQTTYYFMVSVTDLAGQSAESNIVSASLGIAPAYLYVSNADGDDVSIILAGTDSVVATIPDAPSADAWEPRNSAISPDGLNIAVPFRHSDNLWVIEKESWLPTIIEDTSFDEPYAVTYTRDGSEIWVANKQGGGSYTGSITILDATSLQVIATIEDTSFSSPESITVNDTHAFVINRGDGNAVKVDITSRQVVDTVNVGYEPRYGVVSPDGAYLYTADPYDDISKVRTSDMVIETVYQTSGWPRNMAINADGSKVYVAMQNASLFVIDTASGTTSTITFTGAYSTYGVAIIESMGRGYVTDESQDRVYVFDLATAQEIPGELIDIIDFDYPRAIVGGN